MLLKGRDTKQQDIIQPEKTEDTQVQFEKRGNYWRK